MDPKNTKTRLATIGELSARTGVPVKALREYTDLGLIRTPGRSAAGYRLYTDDALWCVRFIGEMRGLGLTIAEIRRLATNFTTGDNDTVGSHLAELLRHSRQRLQQRIAVAQQILDRIDTFETARRGETERTG
ncbi:MerR family transcriptional regulator [Fodinicola feengrottensis]|uniref:HTH merR-type domain-containing protein n=1 Tax=Fodinicola feengrottensis TaxID=435914 RepID=A0ABN2HKU1_9ACTN|nr:MerR family transcriptional regulator [Fodinicola feengrottensis]